MIMLAVVSDPRAEHRAAMVQQSLLEKKPRGWNVVSRPEAAESSVQVAGNPEGGGEGEAEADRRPWH